MKLLEIEKEVNKLPKQQCRKLFVFLLKKEAILDLWEDFCDVRLLEESLKEPGEYVPWEKVKKELDEKFGRTRSRSRKILKKAKK